jgi:uncharacterized protein YjdB
MAFPTTVPDKSSGDIFTTTMWDESIKENINALLNPPGARIRATSGTTTVGNETHVAINAFGSVQWDNGSDHGGAFFSLGSPSRLTVPIDGRYWIGGGFEFDNDSTGNVRKAAIREGGSNYIAQQDAGNGDAIRGVNACAFTVVELDANDYVELMAYQDNGGNLSVLHGASDHLTWFAIQWVGTKI